ncbi:hypothetical protein [Nitrosomonas sp.]|uniref:hypothetical protein n=1 Tax=Nitrosomonas sp. TaxID=42353 RepID=UPI00283D5192|nr:hypothetical protein [Nitrosomonas sp.]MDR4515442.1 hypothetical protein [Nitrosomonas sp.]
MVLNPPAEKKPEVLQGTTLQQAFDDFVAVRKKLKARTLCDYQRIMKTVFADWQNKAMLKINKDMVAKRHSKIGAEHGEAYANLSMRFLRALFNFAIAQYEDCNGHSILRENPVTRQQIWHNQFFTCLGGNAELSLYFITFSWRFSTLTIKNVFKHF